MNIRETFQILLKNWAMKQLTPANVQAVLTAGLAQLRTVTDETENKIDDYVLDFLESIILDPVKIETLTDFIRARLAGVYGDVPPVVTWERFEPFLKVAAEVLVSKNWSRWGGQTISAVIREGCETGVFPASLVGEYSSGWTIGKRCKLIWTIPHCVRWEPVSSRKMLTRCMPD